MQELFDTHYPSLDIQILGVNEDGHQAQNTLMVEESDRLPWLQDLRSAERHVWGDLWEVVYRDVQIVDQNGDKVDTYNVTSNDLQNPGRFGELRDKFIAVAATPAESNWQSPIEPLDINEDNLVTPLDAIIAINALNGGQAGVLAGSPGTDEFFLDVSGEGTLSPLDPLRVINHLNAISEASDPQAALSSAAVVDDTPTDVVFASYGDDADDEDDE